MQPRSRSQGSLFNKAFHTEKKKKCSRSPKVLSSQLPSRSYSVWLVARATRLGKKSCACRAIVTPIPEVSEFLEMPGLAGYGFRYSGAPLALSLEIYLQTIAQSDWNDPEKRKKIVGSAPGQEDCKVNWDSIQPDLIDSLQAGTMADEVADLFVLSPAGKILFAIPTEWYSDPQPGHVSISGEGSSSAKSCAALGFRGVPQHRATRGQCRMGTPQVPAKPISIAHGETAQLVHFARNVHFGGGPEKQSPVYRIVVELKARACIRPLQSVQPPRSKRMRRMSSNSGKQRERN